MARVERRDVPVHLEWTGTLDGDVSADVRPQVEGYVTARLYREGSPVEEGAPLFQIDDRPYRQAYDRARADLAQRVAEQVRARADYARVAPIADTGAVSGEEVTNAFAAADAADAVVAASRAAVRNARLELEWTTVRAPIAGVAGLRQVELGDLVQPTDVLTRVASLDPMRVSFAITEAQYLESAELLRELTLDPAAPASPGARAPDRSAGLTRGVLELVLADGSVYEHPGRFDAVELGIDPRTGTLSIRALFPNPDFLLRPGQFCRVRLRSTAGRNALVVPARALMELQGLVQVAVVDPARATVDIRTVTLGARQGDVAVVKEGVEEGDTVVVEGLQGLREGARVEPKLVRGQPEGPPPRGGPEAPRAR